MPTNLKEKTPFCQAIQYIISLCQGEDPSEKTRWQIELAPKTGGEIRVPALRVGSGKTSPLTLTVTRTPPEVARRQAEQLFIETDLEPAGSAEDVYVQSQVNYTVRLFYALPLLDGALSDPQPADALIERLGEDRSYTTIPVPSNAAPSACSP